MGGSYDHIDSGGWDLIDTMQDAYETVEEMYFLIQALLSPEQIKNVVEIYCSFERGDAQPVEGASPYADAYLHTKWRMQNINCSDD